VVAALSPVTGRFAATATGFALLLLLATCRTGRNYTSAEGPRYAGGTQDTAAQGHRGTTALRVASFNIEFSQQVDSAIAVLRREPGLREADVLLLQEMTAQATEAVATALGFWYVYYPAIYHYRTRRDMGNAVLSRWPIIDDKKIVLPHRSRFVGTQRTATAATLRVGQRQVRVYSTHLGTMGDLAPAARREQLAAVLADAEAYAHVVIGGDMNDAGVGQTVHARGYAWPTQRGPATSSLGRLDHIFFKGFLTPDSSATGTVQNVSGASDHLPVWAVAILR
jgi:endonuclease/exonuclease/phosphatase family metal-dependent hydrolase